MDTKLSINIDTVEWVLEGMQFDNGSSRVSTFTDANGEILDIRQYRVSIKGAHSCHSIHATTESKGAKLVLEGSPYAFLYGQNVFTSADLSTGCINASRQVSKSLQLHPPVEQVNHWRRGNMELRRVDLSLNLRLESENEVKNALQQIKRQLVEHSTTLHTKGHSICWSPHVGNTYSIIFYAKGSEIKLSQKYKSLPSFKQLAQDCEPILRVEVRLRQEALREMKLTKVNSWNHGAAERAFLHYLGAVPLLNVTTGQLESSELSKLPARLRPVLAAHKAGLDLKSIFGVRTLQRHKRDFREMGIDLTVPNRPDVTAYPLLDLISPSRVMPTPKWLKEATLCPEE